MLSQDETLVAQVKFDRGEVSRGEARVDDNDEHDAVPDWQPRWRLDEEILLALLLLFLLLCFLKHVLGVLALFLLLLSHLHCLQYISLGPSC